MILSRRVRWAPRAREELEAAELNEHDDRIAAAIWYFKHDTRLELLRDVGETASGSTLYAFCTRRTPTRRSLVVYVTIEGNMQNITIQSFLAAVGTDGDP